MYEKNCIYSTIKIPNSQNDEMHIYTNLSVLSSCICSSNISQAPTLSQASAPCWGREEQIPYYPLTGVC